MISLHNASQQTCSQEMWSTPKSDLRTYGTYKWRLSLATTEGKDSHEPPVGHELLSPNFMLCGYLWRLRLFPGGWRNSPGAVTMVLTCTGMQPEHAVYYQLVLQNQDDTEKSVAKECARIMRRNHRRHHRMLWTETLYDIQKGFVKQQELIAVVHISLNAADDSTRQATSASPSMFNVFQSHYDDASTSDVIVKAGEVKIHAHKIVLIAHSTLFRAMFQAGTKENTAEEVEMGQIEGPILTALISFMYGRLGDTPADIALPLFVAADAHQVEMLRWTCLQCLLDQVNVETVLEYVVVADAITDQVLMDACMNFLLISQDSVKVEEQPAMQELMKNNTDLAQKLWVGVMKHVTSKRKADEISD